MQQGSATLLQQNQELGGTQTEMAILYFGYGSNLCLPRLRGRVPDVQFVRPAQLSGYVLSWHKRSTKDGSGKCSISAQAGKAGKVYGALFAIPEHQKSLLDRAEGLGKGYHEAEVQVETETGPKRAVTYVADPDYIDDSLSPYSWYRDLVAAGGEALGLPADYLQRIREIPAEDDPDTERDAQERKVLPCDGSA